MLLILQYRQTVVIVYTTLPLAISESGWRPGRYSTQAQGKPELPPSITHLKDFLNQTVFLYLSLYPEITNTYHE